MTAASSLGLLNTSKPPSLHSPDGEMNIELIHTLPWIEEPESLMKASAIWHGEVTISHSPNSHTRGRTDTRCRPHRIQFSRSCAVLELASCSATLRGRTRSVVIWTVVSVSTPSRNLRTSGCRMVRSFRRAFFARGNRLCLPGALALNSNTETGLPSSYTLSFVS